MKLLIRVGHHRLSADVVAQQRLVPPVAIERAPQAVGAALGDNIDVRAGEAALAHVEWRDGDLHLLDRVVRHRLGVGLPAGGRIVEPEGIVEVGAIERDVVVQPVPTGEGEVAVAPRIQSGQVARASLDGREYLDLLGRDERGRAGALGVQDVVPLRRHRDLFQRDRLRNELEVLPPGLPKAEEHVVHRARLEPDHRRGDGIRTADAKIGQAVGAARPHHCAILGTARHVHREHYGIGERHSVLPPDETRDRGRGHALRRGAGSRQCRNNQQ